MPNTFWETLMFVADAWAWTRVGQGLATPLSLSATVKLYVSATVRPVLKG